MEIDLQSLHSNVVREIPIHEAVTFSPAYFGGSGIKGLDDVMVEGIIRKEADGEDRIVLAVEGEMILEDSISLEDVNYPFSISIDQKLSEFVKKDENILDLMEFLWENIVLEIPLKFTKVEDLSKFHGDGWELVREDELDRSDNPFKDLLKEFGEE